MKNIITSQKIKGGLAKLFTLALIIGISIPSSIIARPFLTDPEISVYPENEIVSFADTRIGETRTEIFTIENLSDTDRTIQVTNLPVAPFSYTSSTSIEVTARSTRSVSVSFTPTVIGNFNSRISIRNVSTNESKDIALTGTAVSEFENLGLEVSTTRLNFPRTIIGETAVGSITVTNRNNFEVAIRSNLEWITATNPFLVGEPQATLQPGQSYTQTVNFTPGQAAFFNTVLEIHATSEHGNSVRTVELYGEGILATDTDTRLLEITDSSNVNFGSVLQNSTNTRTIELRNTGTQSVTVTFSNLATTPFISDFNTTDLTTISLNAGEARNIRFRFNPTTVGTFNSTATITTNATNLATRTFTLTGQATSTGTNEEQFAITSSANPTTITRTNNSSNIRYSTNETATTRVRILQNDTLIKTLTNNQTTTANTQYNLDWNATDADNRRVSNGNYRYEITATNSDDETTTATGSITVNIRSSSGGGGSSSSGSSSSSVTLTRGTINPDLNEVAYLNFNNPRTQNVTLQIYDNQNGQLIYSRNYGTLNSGQNNWNVLWNGRNYANNKVSAGNYRYSLMLGTTSHQGTIRVVRNTNHNSEDFVIYLTQDPFYTGYNYNPYTENNEDLITNLTVSPKVMGINNGYVYTSFNLQYTAPVTANILDSQKRLLRTVKRNMPTVAGYHRNYIEWNGQINGQQAPNGQYYFEVTTARLGQYDTDIVPFYIDKRSDSYTNPINPYFNYYTYYQNTPNYIPNSINCMGFVDVESGTEFCNAVQLATQEQIFKGHMDANGVKTLKQDDFVSRAEAAAIIVRVMGITPATYNPTIDGNLGFKDLNTSAWYMPYFKTLSQLTLRNSSQQESQWITTILRGYPDGTIRPNNTLNRAELYKVMFEGIKHSRNIKSNFQINYTVQGKPFQDTPNNENSAWYLPYADIATRTLNGTNFARNYFNSHNLTNQTAFFQPSKAVTRAEIIELIYTLQAQNQIKFQ